MIPPRPRPSGGPAPDVPLRYLVVAAGAFVLAAVGVLWLAPEMAGHYYHPHIVALTHMVTLGWITLTIMGASYQLIPIVLERPIWSERPDGTLEHDGDELIAGAHDGERDPAEGHHMGERHDVRMVVVAGHLRSQPEHPHRGQDERPGRDYQVAQRHVGRGAAGGAGARRDHRGCSPRRMRMRVTPRSISSVSWMKPRSSSW